MSEAERTTFLRSTITRMVNSERDITEVLTPAEIDSTIDQLIAAAGGGSPHAAAVSLKGSTVYTFAVLATARRIREAESAVGVSEARFAAVAAASDLQACLRNVSTALDKDNTNQFEWCVSQFKQYAPAKVAEFVVEAKVHNAYRSNPPFSADERTTAVAEALVRFRACAQPLIDAGTASEGAMTACAASAAAKSIVMAKLRLFGMRGGR